MKKHPQIPPPIIPKADEGPKLSQHALDQLKDAQAELAQRRIEALRLYVPQPKQEEFHKCLASERLVIGGNRCLHGSQTIYDPIAGVHRRVDEIEDDFCVEAVSYGHHVIARATRPFVKGYDHLFSFRLSNGGEIRCTLDHLVLDSSGQWSAVRDVLTPECVAGLLASIEDTCPSGSPEGDHRSTQTPEGFPVGCPQDRHSCDERLRLAAAAVRELAPQPVDVHARIRRNCSADDRVRKQAYILPCPSGDHLSTQDVLAHFSDLGAACGTQIVCTPCSQPLDCVPARRLSRLLFCARPHTTYASGQQASQSCYEVPRQSPEGGNEHLYITSYEYLGKGNVWDIEVPGPNNYVIDGVVNHNSGKSMCTFIEDARAATGQDPYGKYPKEGGVLVCVGRNWQHVGMVIYPMLFKAGAFRIIRDAETGEWRAFNPLTDEARRKESKPAPPLIPPRMIKDMSWVQKNAGYLNKAELINGWTIYCFSSEGEPFQGAAIDLIHIDEDINNENWVGEMQARLADRKGRLVWSAMPHSKNDALLGLSERADRAEQEGVENPIIKKFTLRFLDNAHIDTEEKRKNLERWAALGQDELRMRAEGEFTTESTLMYPTFNLSVHIYPRSELPAGQIPPDWTRYVAIDPGHAVMATLFAAVPPDEKFLLIYDELYIRNCNALIWGEQYEAKAREQQIYAMIMDMHGGALRDLGSGRLPHELYTEELRKRNLKAQLTGYGFIPGSDDIPSRTALVRQMLHIKGDGTTKLKILEGACPNLLREMKRYRKKTTTVNGQVFVTDAPQTRGDVHACQTLEYLCAYEPKYHPPPKTWGPEPWWVKYLADKRRRERKSDDDAVYLAPRGALEK